MLLLPKRSMALLWQKRFSFESTKFVPQALSNRWYNSESVDVTRYTKTGKGNLLLTWFTQCALYLQKKEQMCR